jgi:P-type conjugative transfer protein TrbG
MHPALKTPAPGKDPLIPYNPHAGGVRRDKAGRPVRISPRSLECVFSATGASAVRWQWPEKPTPGIEMKTCLLTALLVSVSIPAWAADPPPQLPAIQPGVAQTQTAAPDPPKAWPGAVQQLSPSAPLDPKSRHGIALVHRWARRPVMPAMGPRGEVRFLYGASQDTVVCAPLQICDIALQPGEIVQNVNLGDATMWNCPPGISGSGAAQVTHLLCKPADAGLQTTLAVQTNRRSYSIELVSTRHDYMPKVGFDYPEDQATQWAAYQMAVGAQAHQPMPTAGYIHYAITGDDPPWRPIEAYSDGRKTFIRFPPAMAYGKAPVLERLN